MNREIRCWPCVGSMVKLTVGARRSSSNSTERRAWRVRGVLRTGAALLRGENGLLKFAVGREPNARPRRVGREGAAGFGRGTITRRTESAKVSLDGIGGHRQSPARANAAQ